MNSKDDCHCGKTKDKRAKECALCAGTSYPVGGLQISKEQIEQIILQAKTYIQLGELLGVKRTTAQKLVEKYQVDISHFKACTIRPLSEEKVYCADSSVTRSHIRKRILKDNKLNYYCSLCNQKPEWRSQELTLELDHINGNPQDNRLENLRFLCPNCHSQTPTCKGKKRI